MTHLWLRNVMLFDFAIDPRFWNWNIAYAKYCDGASFSGNRSEPIDANSTLLYFRGARILKAIVANVTGRLDPVLL